MNRRTFVISFVCLTSVLFHPAIVRAQEATPSAAAEPEVPTEGVDFIVSPPTLDLRTEPGASVGAIIKIKNNNTQTEALRIDLMKFKADASGEKPELLDITSDDDFVKWLQFSETEFTIEPKTWKQIRVSFNPPENASPGYYFAIVFNRQKEVKVTSGQVAKGAAAVLCLVQVNSSRVFHQVDLMNLTSNGFDFKTNKYIYEFLPVNFTVALQNSGNVHEKVVGNIFIDWVTGKKMDVGILEVNPDKSIIMPQSTRSFKASWIDGFPVWEEQKDAAGNPILDKKGNPKLKLKWDFSKLMSFRIGKYNATLTMAYNDGVRDIPLESHVSFWVIPWRILLALLVLIILIIVGIKGSIQNLYEKAKKMQDKKSSRTAPPPIPTNT